MQRAITQYGKNLRYGINRFKFQNGRFIKPRTDILPLNTKFLAWSLFLIYFIESGTLGILPQSMYMVYRNVKISDLLLYIVVIYSFFCFQEYRDLYFSKSFFIIKLILLYYIFQFIISVIAYKVDVIEYFFRLKALWMSLLVFPYMLLLKRNGLKLFVKIFLPFAIISNIFYIISAVTGVAVLPVDKIVQQDHPGGLKVWRVFGGTFFGELFLLGLIFYWNEYRFKIFHIPLIILFALPHVLAFGRGTWIFLTFSIMFIIIWSSYRKKNISATIKQLILMSVTISIFIFAFNKFLPESEELSESIEARIEQGRDDLKYSEGTIGSRLANQRALLDLWSENPVFGIGMHPFWVIKPVTTEEVIYAWGFHDLRWVSLLVAYGAIGILLALIFQLYYMILNIKMLKKINTADINYFFLLIFFVFMFRDSVLGFVFTLFTLSLFALGSMTAFYISNLVYLYEKYKFNIISK